MSLIPEYHEQIDLQTPHPKPVSGPISKTVVILIIVISVAGITMLSRNNTPPKKATASPSLGIATDPKFAEVKNAMIGGFPEIPTYPDAELIGSADTTGSDDPHNGFRAVWHTNDTVAEVVSWYLDELLVEDWVNEPPDDRLALEQIILVNKSGWNGYIAVEKENYTTEIVVDLKETGL